MNVNKFPQTPWIDVAASGIFSQRSGLHMETNQTNQLENGIEHETYLNSSASSPHTDLSRLIRAMGTITV